jgi:uncharacterized protein (TIGR02118 family)
MFKVVFLVKRRPEIDVEAFQARWKAEHGRRAAELPSLRRYVQSHALPQGYRKGELIYDGIDEMWFDDEAAYKSTLASAAYAALDREAGSLCDLSRRIAMPVEVHVIKDGAVPENAVKNIEFVNRRPGMPLEPFRRYWREVHGPIASKIPVLRRYEQNHLRASVYEEDPQPRFDGLAITWFESTADMKRGTETEAYATTRADEPNFLPDGHLPIIITREHAVFG